MTVIFGCGGDKFLLLLSFLQNLPSDLKGPRIGFPKCSSIVMSVLSSYLPTANVDADVSRHFCI